MTSPLSQDRQDYSSQKLIKVLRDKCFQKGFLGIKGLAVAFRQIDVDYSRRICLEELKDGIRRYGLLMSDGYVEMLFRALDKDRNNQIDFCEFIQELRTPITESRKDVINEAFDSLDINRDNAVQVEELRVVFASNALQHPKFRSGEWTEEETLRHFLNGLDTPGCPDGKVTREEFLSYYAGVSATVDDDCYFDLMMRTTYNLSPKGSD